MGRYLDQLDSMLASEKDRVEADIKNALLQLPPEDRDEFESSSWGDVSEIAEDFPNILYSSFLLSWYSFVETSMFLACTDFGLHVTITASQQDDLGKGIRRARNFIARSGGYPLDNQLWNELVWISTIRNSIVHDGGNIRTLASVQPIDDTNAQPHEILGGIPVYVFLGANLYKYCVAHDLIRYRGPNYYFKPNLAFCRYLLNFAKALFDDIYDGLRQHQS
ncbi:MAG: hypothetical protein WBZ24_07090 [Anaerolineales bacterium]